MSDYNGWKNWETWNVNLWISNDKGSRRYWEHRARSCTFDIDRLSEKLCHTYTLAIPENVTGMYLGFIQGCLNAVDWREIAEHLIEGIGV